MSEARTDRLNLAVGLAAIAIAGLLLLQAGGVAFGSSWLLVVGLFALGAVLSFSGLGSGGAAGPGRSSEPSAPPAWTPVRLPDVGVVGGVLAGVAYRAGIDPVIFRVVFASVTLLTGGLGIVIYLAAWLILPTREKGWSPTAIGLWERRNRSTFAFGVALLVLALLVAFRALGLWWGDEVAWPLVLAGFGAAMLWPHGNRTDLDTDRVPWWQIRGRERGGREAAASLGGLYRGGFGIALVVGAALLFLSANDISGPAREFAATATVVLVALALILAPFLWRMGRSLAAERAERIRSQDKAEVAAHLHDSVLQTLTLLQKRADEPDQVSAIAAKQERELRRWLEDRDATGAADGLTAAIRIALEEVEDDHRVKIEFVSVGDAELVPAGVALVASVKEAATNAAKFGGEPIRVFCEVGDGRVEAFVRDRGAGFDLDAVPADRRGVRDSIIARMERHDGTASVDSGEGRGTEIALTLPMEQK